MFRFILYIVSGASLEWTFRWNKKGSRAMSRFLHSIHSVPKRKNAIGKFAAIWLSTWAQQQFVKFEQPSQYSRSCKCTIFIAFSVFFLFAFRKFDTNGVAVHFQESLSGQQSNFFANNDFLGGSKVNDFSSIQGKLQIFAIQSYCVQLNHHLFGMCALFFLPIVTK